LLRLNLNIRVGRGAKSQSVDSRPELTDHAASLLMRRYQRTAWLATFLTAALAPTAIAADVVGRVAMPDVCSPEVSPAVVSLRPADGRVSVSTPSLGRAEVTLINQRGLQFVPRVRAVSLGQSLRFTNEDAETHNVHVVSPGDDFNESMRPGQPRDFTPTKAGVVRVACDVHSHMRAYVVVADTPWVQACSPKGRFRFDGVPDGPYVLTVWHEMGAPLRRDVVVEGGKALDLGTLTVTADLPATAAAGSAASPRVWADVIDRIGVLLACGLDAAGRPAGFAKARRLAEDAYWGEFESSDMETAVRLHLGLARAAELERGFRAVVPALRGLAEEKRSAASALEVTRALLVGLSRAGQDLNLKGVTDGAHLQTAKAPAADPAAAGPAQAAAPPADPGAQLSAVRLGFGRVRALADRGAADDAASTLSAVYFDEFEPLERFLNVRNPLVVRPLEAQFNAIRGDVGAGLKGRGLGDRLDALHSATAAAIGRASAHAAGSFGAAFGASLVTAVREGVEVILLLTMLLALAAKTGQPGATRAILAGVGLAAVASAATALALNSLVASAQGRGREMLEGGVMLAAAGVLFYVSYWLISQSESRRWTEFLKRQAGRAAGSGLFALLATAFLAVYREGAETALMYQAMIGSQAGSAAGLGGLAAGLGVGLVVLAAVAYLIRATSVRLPLRAFFKLTGGVLFGMAVVFAGNGVFELQSSGVLKVTPLAWLGTGLPLLGVHPSVQALAVQGVLLAGAGLALVVLNLGGGGEPTRPKPTAAALAGRPPAEVAGV